MNVSYDNSFSAIKKDLLKEIHFDKRKTGGGPLGKGELIPIEEKPNKPKEKPIVKNMHSNPAKELNLTQEVKTQIQQILTTTPTTAQNVMDD